MDIVEFLRARLDEDEAWAVAASAAPELHGGEVVATGVHWRWGTGENWETVILDPALDEFVGDGDATLLTVEERPALSGRWTLPIYNVRCEEVPSTVAGHITRHDPARVLREVEAKRRIVDACSPRFLDSSCASPGERCLAEVILEDLAAIHSDHADYEPPTVAG